MMDVVLVSPQKELFKGSASSVLFRAKEGMMEILPNHAPSLSELSAGDVEILSDSGIKKFNISSGFAEIHDNKIVLLVRETVGQ
ncbi:FoF1 ATP synthase subunit delta/epsilon [Candidatus Omnitrophota bacterium]